MPRRRQRFERLTRLQRPRRACPLAEWLTISSEPGAQVLTLLRASRNAYYLSAMSRAICPDRGAAQRDHQKYISIHIRVRDTSLTTDEGAMQAYRICVIATAPGSAPYHGNSPSPSARRWRC